MTWRPNIEFLTHIYILPPINSTLLTVTPAKFSILPCWSWDNQMSNIVKAQGLRIEGIVFSSILGVNHAWTSSQLQGFVGIWGMVLWYPCLHSRNRSVGKPSLFFLYCTLYTATKLSIIYMPPPCGCYTVEPFWVLVISRMVCNLNSLSVAPDYVVSQKCSNTPSTGFLLMFPVMTLFLLFGFGFQTIRLCGAWL